MGTAIVVIDGVQRSSVDRSEQTKHQQGRPTEAAITSKATGPCLQESSPGGGAPVPGVPRNNLPPSGNVT